MGVLVCLRESGLVGMGAMLGGDVIQSRFFWNETKIATVPWYGPAHVLNVEIDYFCGLGFQFWRYHMKSRRRFERILRLGILCSNTKMIVIYF